MTPSGPPAHGRRKNILAKGDSMKKIIIFPIMIIIIFSFIIVFIVTVNVKTQIKDFFRMNKRLQEEGYYMGDFEFKMLGIAYWLDKGQYFKVLHEINSVHQKLKNREGLFKITEFKSKEEEMEFYLSLQNPETGAFIDSHYPYCTYNEITVNILNHLSSLSKETGKPLQLKYELKYLDDISTPEKLRLFLDDVAYVGLIASKLPHTSFIFARSLLSFNNIEGVIKKENLYKFSPEWEKVLLQWFYENQDPETGMWGPRTKIRKKLLVKDLTNTASIIKTFVDREGNNIYKEYPLRFKDKLFRSTLDVLQQPIPGDSEIDQWHEWNLKMGKGIPMLMRYLWNETTDENKEEAKKIIENYLEVKFEKNYIPEEGAFSYYPGEKHASLDGLANFFIFKEIGAFDKIKQENLWGNMGETAIDLGIHKVDALEDKRLSIAEEFGGINSIRVFSSTPNNNYSNNIEMIIYINKTSVLDIIDLTLKIKKWIEETPYTMGNWTSKETVKSELNNIKIDNVPIYDLETVLKIIKTTMQKNNRIILIGFDELQVPRKKIVIEK